MPTTFEVCETALRKVSGFPWSKENFFDLIDGLDTVLRIDLLGGIALSIEKRFDFYLVEWQEPVGNSNTPVDRRQSIGRPKYSWIWKYFDSEIRDDYKWAICKLDKLGGSTNKNCIDHLLNKHNLCSDEPKDDQKTITVKIINKHQVVENMYFCQLIQKLDSAFNIPDFKSVKTIIHRVYNYTFDSMVNLL
ncbi:hypothetical protein RhiirA4_456078 [Rhizophagus irregularis]|uniref:Uncharacterized protein n=1 Tax=Rhizophagus irregularis TaxID=588596 RepID=A0A2I1G6S3_9GLOM|nr:hypothetical protein RhiirA4_456078 [Rhizophagus irregularis]